jgi:hypothetical protein
MTMRSGNLLRRTFHGALDGGLKMATSPLVTDDVAPDGRGGVLVADDENAGGILGGWRFIFMEADYRYLCRKL